MTFLFYSVKQMERSYEEYMKQPVLEAIQRYSDPERQQSERNSTFMEEWIKNMYGDLEESTKTYLYLWIIVDSRLKMMLQLYILIHNSDFCIRCIFCLYRFLLSEYRLVNNIVIRNLWLASIYQVSIVFDLTLQPLMSNGFLTYF